MVQVKSSAVSLRIIGDELIPQQITDLLKCNPTKAYAKGDAGASGFIKKHGMWWLEAIECEPENVNRQVQEVLAKLPDDMKIWQSLIQAYKVDLFCGLFMGTDNEGITLSSETLRALGERGIEIGFDIYAVAGAGD